MTLARARKALDLLQSDPRLLVKRLYVETRFRLPFHPGFRRTTANGVTFEYDFSFDPSIKLMYHAVYEVDMVSAMKRALRPGDAFIDVGANIGYLSAVAMGLVGAGGSVHSFEPVPRYFARLKRLGELNPSHGFRANETAVGESEGTAAIAVTNLPNIGWNTMVPGLMSREATAGSIDVPVCTLSSYIRANSLSRIAMVKIDTEGYEFPVLKGLRRYLEESGERPLIAVEIAPTAYRLLGSTTAQLRDFMGGLGYAARSLREPPRPVDIASLTETTNVLFTAT